MKALISTISGFALVLILYVLPVPRDAFADDGKVCANGKNGCLPTAICYPEPGTCQNNSGGVVDYDGYQSIPEWIGSCDVGTGTCSPGRIRQCSTMFFIDTTTSPCSAPVCNLDSYTKSACPEPPAP